MFSKIKKIEDRFKQLENDLSRPEIIKDQKTYQRYSKELSNLSPIVNSYRQYISVQEEIENNRSLLDDPDQEMRKLAREEIETLKADQIRLEKDLKILLLPKDPNDEKKHYS